VYREKAFLPRIFTEAGAHGNDLATTGFCFWAHGNLKEKEELLFGWLSRMLVQIHNFLLTKSGVRRRPVARGPVSLGEEPSASGLWCTAFG
jgi:hypothetical protein